MYAFGVMSLLCLWGYHDRDSWYLRFVAAVCVDCVYSVGLGRALSTRLGLHENREIVDPIEGAKIGAVLISPWIGRDAVRRVPA